MFKKLKIYEQAKETVNRHINNCPLKDDYSIVVAQETKGIMFRSLSSEMVAEMLLDSLDDKPLTDHGYVEVLNLYRSNFNILERLLERDKPFQQFERFVVCQFEKEFGQSDIDTESITLSFSDNIYVNCSSVYFGGECDHFDFKIEYKELSDYLDNLK